MPKATAQPPRPAVQPRFAVFLLALPPLLFALWLAGWTGNDAKGDPLPGAHADFLWTFFTSLPWAAAWLASAWGFGWAAMHWLVKPIAPFDRSIEVGIGVAILLFLDVALGTLGFLHFITNVGAWLVIIIGLVLLVTRAAIAKPQTADGAPSHWFALAWIAATPAIAVLLIAACSAPGWLWRTEFGGYDALSYHLQLPREWIEAGRIQGFEHNVYSFMPNYMESAYDHIALLVGDGIHAAYACQLLHVGFTILAAWLTARVAFHFAGQIAGFCAFLAVLGTPWTIVTGSLAYNEMAVALLLATSILVLQQQSLAYGARAAFVGALLGIACGAKLTSIGFVVAPVVLLTLIMLRKRLALGATLAAMTFLLALTPYLLRNLFETGNPVFPFATNIFGSAHWSAEQVTIWNQGHAATGSALHRLGELWNQFLRFGFGTSPYADEPWLAQWSILPWLGMLGLAVALTHIKLRMHAIVLFIMLVLQLAFWLFFTHLKSRFLLPTVVPLAIGLGLGVAAIRMHLEAQISRFPNMARLGATVAGLTIACLWCVLPVVIFAGEPDADFPAPAARLGRIEFMTGEAFPKHDRAQLAGISHIIAINELPAGSHTLLVGEAAPFYLTGNIAYQTTWDRGPLSRLMREHPDDAAQWIAGLRNEGFTHLFIQESMLIRWERAGWNDPLITAPRVTSAAEQHAQRIQVTPAGVLYQLK